MDSITLTKFRIKFVIEEGRDVPQSNSASEIRGSERVKEKKAERMRKR